MIKRWKIPIKPRGNTLNTAAVGPLVNNVPSTIETLCPTIGRLSHTFIKKKIVFK